MEILTPRLKIKKTDGNEYANRISINEIFDTIDANTMILGQDNTDINKTKALELKIDTRKKELGYTDGNLTSVVEKDKQPSYNLRIGSLPHTLVHSFEGELTELESTIKIQ